MLKLASDKNQSRPNVRLKVAINMRTLYRETSPDNGF